MAGTLIAGIFIGLVLGFLLYWILERFLLGIGPTPKEAYLAEQLTAAEEKASALSTQLSEAQSHASQPQYIRADRLQKLNGIGNVYAQKLNDAGIFTFAQVAKETAERLAEIIQPESWQTIEPEAWIAEAANLAAEGN